MCRSDAIRARQIERLNLKILYDRYIYKGDVVDFKGRAFFPLT